MTSAIEKAPILRRPARQVVALETGALRKVYESSAALDGVDLRVERASVYGLVGPNEAGKTTLLGILRPAATP